MGVTGARATRRRRGRVAGRPHPRGHRPAGLRRPRRLHRRAGRRGRASSPTASSSGSALVRSLLDAADSDDGHRPSPATSPPTSPPGVRRQPRQGGDLLMLTALPLDDPQPHDRGLAPRAAARPRLRPVHPRRHRRGRLDDPASGSPTRGGKPGQVLDISAWAVPFGIVGGRIYHVITSPQAYFGEGGEPVERVQRSGRAASASGAPSPSARSAPRSAAGARASASSLRRRGRARAARRPGHGPVRQLVQQRDLRRADRPAVGPQVYEWDQAAGHAVLDADGNPVVLGVFHPTFLYEAIWCLAARGAADLAGPPATTSAAARSSRSTSRATRSGAVGHRAHAHRRREPHPRAAAQLLGVDPRVPARALFAATSWFGRRPRTRPDELEPESDPKNPRRRGTNRNIGMSRPRNHRTLDATDILSAALADAAQPPLIADRPAHAARRDASSARVTGWS